MRYVFEVWWEAMRNNASRPSSPLAHLSTSILRVAALAAATLGATMSAAQPAGDARPLVITSQSAVSVFERELSISTSGLPVAPLFERFMETRVDPGDFYFVVNKEADGVLQHPDGSAQAIAKGAVTQSTIVAPGQLQYLAYLDVYASGAASAGASFQSHVLAQSTYDVIFQVPGPEVILRIRGTTFPEVPTGQFQLSVVDQTLGQTLWTFEHTGPGGVFPFDMDLAVQSGHDYRLTAKAEISLSALGNQATPDPERFRITGAVFTVSAVPEPATWLLMLAGLAGVAATRGTHVRRGVGYGHGTRD